MKKGIFIVFEGIDGAGKSTQALRLADFLKSKGIAVTLTREPTDGPWGQKIRQIAARGRAGVTLRDELDFFVRDREEHVAAVIAPVLESGGAVICDRYYHSNIAYQGALGLDPSFIRELNEDRHGFPKPDVVFLLDINPENGIGRIEAGRAGGANEGFEKLDFLKKVKSIFDAMPDPFIKKISAEKPLDVISGEINDIIVRLIR